jgi:hypothetical protein
MMKMHKITKGEKPIKIKYTGKKPCKITNQNGYIEIETDDLDFIKKMKTKGFKEKD